MDQYNQQPVGSNTLITYDILDTYPNGDNSSQSGQHYVGYYDNILGNQILSEMCAAIPPQSESDPVSPQITSPPSSTYSEQGPSLGPISISHVFAKQERRRYQNRISQRAFRERKAKERSTLEEQLKQLADKHQRVLQSYSSQSVEVGRLKAEIQELTKTINALRGRPDGQNVSTDGAWTEELLQDLFF